MLMAAKSGRMVIYNEEFPFIKSQDPFVTWFSKVM